MMSEELLIKYEPIIYYHIHKLKLWRQFPSYRDDFVQEGRMAILKAYQRYEGESNVGAYINTTIRNAIYDYAFKEMKLHINSRNLQYSDVRIHTPSEDHAGSDAFFIKEMMEDSEHKQILKAYFIENRTQKYIADAYGVSQQWVSLIIRKFKEEMKNELL